MSLKSAVGGILDKHEECEARKEEERLREAEERELKRELVAQAVEKFLLSTVKPVFDEVEILLSERGYKVEVTTVARKDNSVGREKEYFLEVTLAVNKGGYTTFLDNKLSYKGSFDEEAIVVETVFPNEKSKKMPLALVSQFELATIEKDVESFLEKAFAC